jgi:hypothetical protein
VRRGQRIAIEAHDFGPAPCVLRMTMPAFRALGRRHLAVKSPPAFDIRADLDVTCQAEPALGLLAKRLVALATILLDVGMRSDHRAGHNESLERYRARRFR